jgi:hypothetical protein
MFFDAAKVPARSAGDTGGLTKQSFELIVTPFFASGKKVR